jgi:hypothetical protein
MYGPPFTNNTKFNPLHWLEFDTILRGQGDGQPAAAAFTKVFSATPIL